MQVQVNQQGGYYQQQQPQYQNPFAYQPVQIVTVEELKLKLAAFQKLQNSGHVTITHIPNACCALREYSVNTANEEIGRFQVQELNKCQRFCGGLCQIPYFLFTCKCFNKLRIQPFQYITGDLENQKINSQAFNYRDAFVRLGNVAVGRNERVMPKCLGNGVCGPFEEIEAYDEKDRPIAFLKYQCDCMCCLKFYFCHCCWCSRNLKTNDKKNNIKDDPDSVVNSRKFRCCVLSCWGPLPAICACNWDTYDLDFKPADDAQSKIMKIFNIISFNEFLNFHPHVCHQPPLYWDADKTDASSQ